MRMREVWKKVSEAAGQLRFEDLFDDDHTRVDVVITFLALLELLKQRKVKVKQTRAFAPIHIVPQVEQNGS